MDSFAELLLSSQHKTRVGIFSSIPEVARLLVDLLDNAGKDFDYSLQNGLAQNNGSDFIIFESADSGNISQFQPNILFISSEIEAWKTTAILEKVIRGGIVIYPEALENTVEEGQYFFRKLPFSDPDFKKENAQLTLHTEIGTIPLNTKAETYLNEIEGMKLLAQQFGVMEEEFYEALMNFA